MHLSRRTKKTFVVALYTLIIFSATIAILSYLTNPFTRYTRVQSSITTTLNDQGQLELKEKTHLKLKVGRLYSSFLWLKSGYHILGNVYTGGKKSHATTSEQIIRDIHQLRFNPQYPYLISGDHFSTLYPRSLGIFYHTLLDPRTALDEKDWLHRQQIYAQTTAYALDAFEESPQMTTTIVPVGVNSVSLMNIYNPPSDTLFSILYALDAMKSSEDLEKTYPFSAPKPFALQTQTASHKLLEKYKPSLIKHYHSYVSTLTDAHTGLVRIDKMFSGTKDITMRQGAFYDNVMLWKTHQLAQKLGLTEKDPQKLDELKKKIVSAFWMEDQGCFLEDQSEEAKKGRYYSSDWLIVLETQFLDPSNPEELKYFEKCVAYIDKEKINQPFGVKYQQDVRKHRQYPVVRTFAPAYGGTTIWSHWGQEYIKTLALLYQVTGKKEYLTEAQRNIAAYQENIKKYGCYPELYDDQGNMFHNAFYKSVCQTGWVVNFEQAQKMVEFAAKSS